MSFIVHRVAKSAARYTDAGGREKCGYCRFFVAPRTCGKVIGPVSPAGWCKYFSRQAVSLSGGGLAASAGGASFDQNFLTGSLGAGAVFTRASTGTYYDSAGVLRSAAINTPRFDYDPQTLQLKGLLLEDTSTNVALQSTMGVAPWTPYGIVFGAPTITANNVAAPDGTTTGTRIVFVAVSGAGAAQGAYQQITATAVPYTFSVWLRGAVGGEQTYIHANLVGGQFTNSGRLTLTTQWQRYTVTTPALTAATWTFIVGTDLRDGTQTSTPAQTIYAWGAQVEALPYMSSYIPTTSVSVTRAADSLRYPIASVTGFSQTQGSLAHEYIVEGVILGYSAPVQLVGADFNTDYIDADEFAQGTPTAPTVYGAGILKTGATVTFTPVTGVPNPAGPIHRGASSWLVNGAMFSAHEGIAATTGPGAVTALPVITALTIAGPMHYQAMVGQWARRARYWPRQLSQAELIAETVVP